MSPVSLTASAPSALVGRAEPRLCTPPARELTPETSLGFECIDFAESVLGMDLFPWQKWFLVHALELNEDGSYRFNTVMLIVARQNGKTELLKLLALWKMFCDDNRLVLGAAQSLDQAGESWTLCGEMIEDNPVLRKRVPGKTSDWWKKGNRDSHIRLGNGAIYRIVSANRRAGRGKSVDTLLLDELREQRDWDGWGALSKTTTARPNHQKFLFSNAGDRESVVYNHLRAIGRAGVEGETVEGEDLIGLFEWSAPDNADPEDETCWPMANPSLNIKVGGRYTITTKTLRGFLRDDPPDVFKTENLCMSVDALDSAIDLAGWQSGANHKGEIAPQSTNIALCIDVDPEQRHVALLAAQKRADGRVFVEVVNEWRGRDAVTTAAADLPGYLDHIRPGVLGWFPGAGGALSALLDTDIGKLHGVKVVKLAGQDVTGACMGFAEQVTARRISHKGDAMLTGQVSGARKLLSGDGWKFMRREDGRPVNAVYAAAGAVHLARTFKSLGKPRIVTAD